MSFVRNIAKLTAGTTISQALNIILMPVITRMFLPDAFGDLAVFTSVVVILSSIITMRYEMAIVLPKEDSVGVNLLALCLVFSFAISGIALIATIFLGEHIFSVFNVSISPSVRYLIVLMLLFTGIFVSLDNWSIRKGYFSLIAIRRVSQSAITQILRVIFGSFGLVSGVFLIFAAVLGQAFAAMSLVFSILKKDGSSFKREMNRRSMFEAAKRYRDFPRYSTWSNFLNILSQNQPALFLAYFFNSGVVGAFALGAQVLSVPMGFIGSSVAQVYFQKASIVKHEGLSKLAYVVEHMFDKLFIFSLFPFLVLTVFGKELFSFVFGAQWAEAGIYAQILSLTIFVNFIASILSTTFTVLEMQKEGLVLVSIFFFTRLVALCSGFLTKDPRTVLVIYAAFELVTRIFQCGWIIRASGASVSHRLLIYFGIFLAILAVLICIKFSGIADGYRLLYILTAATGIYYCVAVINDRHLKGKVAGCWNKILS